SAVYGPTGYRWFDDISYKIEGDKVIINGTHRLGNHFTRFFKAHISNNLGELEYEIDSLEVTFIEHKNNTREDRIELIFSR
ncbi:MAG: hypothetical protein ACTSYI_13610, partial [Promethearchaeota archaeon]